MLNSLQGENFRFALLADIHVSDDSMAFDDLQRSVGQINNTKGIDFVIVDGDITGAGDRNSMLKVKSLLDKLNVKYYITSGNHETKWSESGATDFGKIFGSDRFGFEHKGFYFLGFNSGPVIRMADGHVSPQDITWLKDKLKLIGKEKPVILVTHYPLLDGDVDNWYEVTDAVRPYNVRAILSGHYHRNLLSEYDGIPAVINRSNLRGSDAAGGYSVYEVNADSILVFEQKIGEEPYKWGGYSLKKEYFPVDNSGYKRPDYSVNKTYCQVKEFWTVNEGAGIYSSPVIYGNHVYVGDDLGYLTCRSFKNGKLIWKYRTYSRIVGTPGIDDGIIVFGSADKNIYGINAGNGRLIWKYAAKEAVLGAVNIADGIAYIGASDHAFRALDVKTGKLKWEYCGVKGYIEARPLIYENKVIFGAWDDNLYALDKATGKELWKWEAVPGRMLYSPAAVWPVAANGKVFIVDPQRAMTAIDVNSGKTIWRTYQSKVRETIGISQDRKRVYGKTMQDSVVCFSAEENLPKQLWATDVKFGYEHAPSMLIEKDGIVFGSTKNGLIFAVDSMTGKLIWKHKVDNSLVNTVVPLTRSECVFTTSSGKIGILEISTVKRSNK